MKNINLGQERRGAYAIYTTRTHDSLKISNGKWMWWSRGIGGRSALDYLIKVKDYSFLEAVELLAGQANIQPPLSVSEQLPVEKHLLLPKENRYHTNVFSYLTGRGIDNDIVRFCIETGRIYESAYHHNAVFVGMDQQGKPQYAALRGINTDFIGEANGSDKNHSFSIPAEKMSDKVHVFESAIDLLSYATMQKLDGKEWRMEHLLSLAGVYQSAKEIEKSKVPAALTRFLTEHIEQADAVNKKYKRKRISGRLLIAAAVICTGMGVTVAAKEFFKWNDHLLKRLEPSEEQQETMQESTYIQNIDQSVTQNGVTVTLTGLLSLWDSS